MYGPKPPRSWPHRDPSPFQGLTAGTRYQVVRSFRDYDGDSHDLNESWVYLGRNFVPYEDGLSLFVSLDGLNEWQIRLQWRPEQQGAVIDNLHEYVRPVA